MKIKIAAALAVTGAALLAGCSTMSKDQCLAGAWGEQGYKDGAAGLLASRLAAHAEACAKHGVLPDESAYMSAREDGLRTYCTWENGFRAGREGESYGGVCSAAEEESFLPAYQDGRRIHVAEEALSSARSSLNSAINRISDREEKLAAKQRELRQSGLTEEERQRVRDRIQEVRGEIEEARRNARWAEDEVRHAEMEVRAVRRALEGRYRLW